MSSVDTEFVHCLGRKNDTGLMIVLVLVSAALVGVVLLVAYIVHSCSKVLGFPSADCSRSFNRADDICSIPQEVVHTTDAPGESKCADDPMDFSDITVSKRVAVVELSRSV